MKQTINNNFSRQFLGLGIVTLMIFLAVGCGKPSNPANGNNNSANNKTAAGNIANSNTNTITSAANTPVNQPKTTLFSRESVKPENRAETTVTKAATQEKEEIFQLFKKNDDEIEDEMLKSFTVRKMDLNSDGQPEYVAVLEDETICGNLANCPQSIYDKKGGEYNLLLETRARVIRLEKNSTNGYRDLRTELGDSASTFFYYIYQQFSVWKISH